MCQILTQILKDFLKTDIFYVTISKISMEYNVKRNTEN